MRSGAVIAGMVGALVVLHHDLWLWDDPTLVAGFLPIGLAWHGAFSFVAAGLWWLVIRFAWPEDPFKAKLP